MRNFNPDNPISVGSVISIEDFGREKFVIGKILQGGMGTVLQLIPVREHLPALALKTYLNTADPELFKREAKVWISLGTHPYIAHAVWYGIFQEKASILAEWYPSTLNEIAIAKWSPQKIIQLVLKLIEGLQFAMQKVNLIHKDIKPDNILFDDKGSPKISDFGLARFASSKTRPVNYNDSLLILQKTVSFGPIGGTPPYMAPELLFGEALPSEQTDIFSLGVTIYEMLTRTHPFIDPISNRFTNYNLRLGPLKKILYKYGEVIHPLIRLLQNALIVDPKKRPQSYDVLLKSSGLQTKPRIHKKLLDDFVAKAALYRRENKYTEAIKILNDASKVFQDNPILLNSQAITYLKLEKQKEAIRIFKMAVEILESQGGMWEGKLYCDPAINLANLLLGDRLFDEASFILKKVVNWAPKNNNIKLTYYAAIGWLMLYEGNFVESCNHILRTYKYRAPDILSLQWLTLAGVLSKNISKMAEIISSYFSSLDFINSSLALCACLLANALPSQKAEALYKKAIKNSKIEIGNAVKGYGFTLTDLKKPIPKDLYELIISSLDMHLTGGKFSGLL